MLMPADLAEFTDVTCMHHRSPVRYDLRQGDCVMLKELGGKWKFATVRYICGEELEIELEDISGQAVITITKNNIAAIVLD